MINIEQEFSDFPIITLQKGDKLIVQGEKPGCLFFLIDGDVSVIKDDVEVALSDSIGAVFGEMSVLLGAKSSASVVCVNESRFYKIENPKDFLCKNPKVMWHISQVLSLRLSNISSYLVDVKHMLDGETHQRLFRGALKILREQN